MEKQQIYQALTAINKEVEAIKKDQTNTQQGFKYRGIDQVMNDLHSLFAKHEVLITSEVLNSFREERVNKNGTCLIWTIIDYKFIFTANDGTSISSVARGEAMDSGDKGSNKCISVALKYVLFNMFLIPTEEMKDPDAESHDVAPKSTKTISKTTATITDVTNSKNPTTDTVPANKILAQSTKTAPLQVQFDKAKCDAELKKITTKSDMGIYWKENKELQGVTEFRDMVTEYGNKLTK